MGGGGGSKSRRRKWDTMVVADESEGSGMDCSMFSMVVWKNLCEGGGDGVRGRCLPTPRVGHDSGGWQVGGHQDGLLNVLYGGAKESG
jgi:hypothetical protein